MLSMQTEKWLKGGWATYGRVLRSKKHIVLMTRKRQGPDPSIFQEGGTQPTNVFYDEVRGSSRYKSHPDQMIPFESCAKENAVWIRIGIPPLIIAHEWSFWGALVDVASSQFASCHVRFKNHLQAGRNMRTEDKAQGPLLGLPLYLQRWHNPSKNVYMN